MVTDPPKHPTRSSYLDRHPNITRLILGLFIVFLFGFSIYNFLRYSATPTDENWFTDVPSHLVIWNTFPAALELQDSKIQKSRVKPEHRTAPGDSVHAGDLLLKLENRYVYSAAAAMQQIGAAAGDSIDLLVFRPASGYYLQYKAAKQAISDSFVTHFKSMAWVFDVIEKGASDRAGMRAGDIILEINGETFKDLFAADRILRSGRSGKIINYKILRQNQIFIMPVRLARYGIEFNLMIFVLCGWIYMLFGAFLILSRPQLKAARLLGSSMVMIGCFMTLILILREFIVDDYVYLRQLIMYFTLYFGVALWIHTHFYFPVESPELLRKRRLRLIPYGFALVSFILSIPPRADPRFYLGVVIPMLYFIVLRIIYKKKQNPEHKKLVKPIKWAGYVAVLFSVILLFLTFNRYETVKMGYIGIPLLLLPISYLYTIGRYRLLNLDLRIRRNIQYTFVSTLWITLLMVFFFVSLSILKQISFDIPNIHFSGTTIEIIDSPIGVEEQHREEKWVVMLFAILMAFLFLQVGRYGKKLIDQKYYRVHYNYRDAIDTLSRMTSGQLNITVLAQNFVDRVANLMHLKKACLLLFRDHKVISCCQAYHAFNKEWHETCLTLSPELYTNLSRRRMDHAVLVDYMPTGLKQPLQDQGFRQVIPIHNNNTLIGALLAGEKRSETPFDQEDLEFLNTAASQASTTIVNSYLYADLAEKERLKHELSIARRIQTSSLPQTIPFVKNLDISGITFPALEVGGDYYDFLNGNPGSLMVILGDVSGKGISAALYMAKVQGVFRSLYGFKLSPSELFLRANDILCRDFEKSSFATAIGATFYTEEKKMILARAGHLPLYYFNSRKGLLEQLTPGGIGLGLDRKGLFAKKLEEQTIHYQQGDIFIFISDGITEARNSENTEFGEEQVFKPEWINMNARSIRDHIMEAVNGFVGDREQLDDQTIVVVKAN